MADRRQDVEGVESRRSVREDPAASDSVSEGPVSTLAICTHLGTLD